MLFLSALFLVFLAELGDKTQLFLVALSSRYRLPTILFGILPAVLLLSGIGVFVGVLAGEFLPRNLVQFTATVSFLAFALLSLLPPKNDEKNKAQKLKKRAILSVFGGFFLAELGDKTQFSTVALASQVGASDIPSLFFGAALGLFLADLVGILIGGFLARRMPDYLFSFLSFGIFAIFGFTGLSGFLKGLSLEKTLTGAIFFIALVAFFAISVALLLRDRSIIRIRMKQDETHTKGHQSISAHRQ